MKKSLFFAAALLGSVAFAQQQSTGKVGVNTDAPTETLQVKGTARVTNLPEQGETITTNASGTYELNQNFTPTKMVVTDANGVLGKADLPSGGNLTAMFIDTDTSNSSQTVDLSAQPWRDIYVIRNKSTTSNGYSLNVKLPNNIPSVNNSARILRVFITAPNGGNAQGVKISTIANSSNKSLFGKDFIAGYTVGNGFVSIGNSNQTGMTPYERVFNFIEVDGKWYFDRSIN
ncbi:hypothetical protein [Ornithobacterium rhinotracheale]|uniref:hypothetical protein n=1 Tax=Ornithobacterium rhinotracheale TaxID=28251 RepID=UPI0039FD9F7B